MAFNKKTHLRQNIDALKTAFTLDRERRAPTPEEERTLGAYSGFGAIKEVLENPTGKPDKDGMATLVAELQEVIRANTPDEREYKRYMDGIKNSVLTAFYTPPKVADAIVEAIWDTRIAPQRILDPSAGTGVFVNAVDFHDPYAEITCFEKDPATGLILKHLHPEKRVRIQGFERIEPKYAGYYDVAVSNIPFGDVALFDPFFSTHTDPVRRQGTRALHNYFFMKSVDMVREGGLVAFITSQGVLNAEQGRPVREWLMNRCEPVSAIRLPNNLFTEHAGTEVGSDLVILQKKAATGELSERQRDFIESRKLSNGIRINNLFQSFDRVIHTEAKVGKDPYGKPAMECKYSINSLVYWVTYVHNVVYSFYRSMIYCYINSTQRCAGSIVIDIIPTNGADKRKFFPFAPYFPVTNVIKRYFYPYFPAIIGIKGYSFPYFPYLSGIMKIKTALYSLFSRLDWHKTVVFPCLGEIYEGIRSLSWEIPVT